MQARTESFFVWKNCSVPVQPKNRRQSQVSSTHIPTQVSMLPKLAMRRDVLDWFHNSHLQAPTLIWAVRGRPTG